MLNLSKIPRVFCVLSLGIVGMALVPSVLAQEKSPTPTLETDPSPAQKTLLQWIEDTPPRFEILLNIPATQITVYEDGVPVRHHKVSVGTPRWPTPTGKYHIDEIQWNPWWLPPKSEWAQDAEKTPPGPSNPLHPVKLMMEKALRIHGTRSGWSIGRAASHGCMRMRRGEIRSLAEFLEAKLVENHDPQVFQKYRTKTWQTFRTVIPKKDHIWVYMVYEPLERWSNQLVLHPNYYGRRMDYDKKVIDLLIHAGVYTAPIDLGKFHAIRKKSRRTTVIPFQDILSDQANSEGLSPAFSPICWAEGPHPLETARQRYNTRLQSTVVPVASK